MLSSKASGYIYMLYVHTVDTYVREVTRGSSRATCTHIAQYRHPGIEIFCEAGHRPRRAQPNTGILIATLLGTHHTDNAAGALESL